MGNEEMKHPKKEGSEVRHALEGMKSASGHKEESSIAHHVTPFEIGSHPASEDQPLAREIHIFGPDNLDRALFCRQLATMIEVGIPLLRSLQLLSKRTSHPRMAQAIARVAKKVEEGQSVSAAMLEDSVIFSPIVCNIVRVGEVGGILEDSLVRLAQIMETKADMNRKIRAALMYPTVALSVAFVVITLIMVKAVPVFVSAFSAAEHELPARTQALIGLSNFTKNYFWIWLPALVAAIFGLRVFSRTPGGRRVNSALALHFPVVSRITKKIGVARFSRTLSGLLSAGVPLTEAMAISAETNENVIISEALTRVHRSIEKGERMGLPLARARVFPLLTIDMIAIGEETGTLDRMLERIADIFDAEVDSALRGLSSIIEPLLIIVLGGIVIFIALAVLEPYFSLVKIV